MRRAIAFVLSAAMLMNTFGSSARVYADDRHQEATSGLEVSAQGEPEDSEASASGTPETSAPETSAPETNAPETSAPETSAPETSAPETNAPETSAPETSAPETNAPETSVPETAAPETSVPETAMPESSEPEASVSQTESNADANQTGNSPSSEGTDGNLPAGSSQIAETLSEENGNTDDIPLTEGNTIPADTEASPSTETVSSEVPLIEDIDAAESETESEDNQTETEEKKTAFAAKEKIDGIIIRVSAPKGVFPAHSTLSVEKVPQNDAAAQQVNQAIESERPAMEVAQSYTYDIKVLDQDGNEIEPDTSCGEVKVTFSLSGNNLPTLYDDVEVYHVTDAPAGQAETLAASARGDSTSQGGGASHLTLAATTDSFSYYIVEFYYSDLEYVLKGDASIALSEIQNTLGITGAVASAVFSNPELVSVTKNESGDDWTLTALKAFDTEETLTLTMGDGTQYQVKVTDEQETEPYIAISVNGGEAVNASLENHNLETAPVTAYYGDNISFSILGIDNISQGTVHFMVSDGTNDQIDWQEWGTIADKWDLTSGYHYVGGVWVPENGEAFESHDGSYGIHMEKGTYEAPVLNDTSEWDGGRASWESVTKTVSGGDADPDSVAYTAELLRNGEVIETIAGGTFSHNICNFTEHTKTYGTYTYRVKAVPKTTAQDLYEESSYSAESAAYTVYDTTPPSITAFTGDGSSKKLTAVVKDEESGVFQYAFSKEDSLNSVTEEEWNTLESAVVGEDVTLTKELTSDQYGTYYLHVKDKDGNGTTYSNQIVVTSLVYSGYYNGQHETQVLYQCVTGDLTSETSLADPRENRPGYTFRGWKDSSGENISAENITKGTQVTLYADWVRDEIQFKTEPSDYPAKGSSAKYDGEGHTLTASVIDKTVSDEGGISWRWYKKSESAEGEDTPVGEAISGTSASYTVTDVADSGEYYARVTVTLDGDPVPKPTQTVSVAITQKPVDITANSLSIAYNDEAPQYTYTVSSLVGKDLSAEVSLSDLFTGGFQSNYAKGFGAGTYEITAVTGDGQTAAEAFSADNYSINAVNGGTLTVSPKNVENNEDITVTLNNLSDAEMVYTGEELRPKLSITDSANTGENKQIDSSNYTVAYVMAEDETKSAKDVGWAKAVVTFRGNYTGTREVSFKILPADNTVSVQFVPSGSSEMTESWVYGTQVSSDSENAEIILQTSSISDGAVSYTFQKQSTNESGDSTWEDCGSEMPVNAGTYQVQATVAATNNYKQAISEWAGFTIQKRTVSINIPSRTGEESITYDGTTHSFSGEYTMEGTFAQGEGFAEGQPVISGSIKDVGEVVSQVTCQFNENTNIEDNYEFTVNNGVITVVQAQLPAPESLVWSSAAEEIGTAEWLQCNVSEITPMYYVTLWRKADHADAVKVNEYVSDYPSYNFNEIIKQDAAAREDGAYSYYFTVYTAPYEQNSNYKASDVTSSVSGENNQELYTAFISVKKDEGVDTLTVNHVELEQNGKAVILQGETLPISFTLEAGYTEDSSAAWSIVQGEQNLFTIDNPKDSSASLTLTGSMFGSASGIQLYAWAEDLAPEITQFSGNIDPEDAHKVVLSLQASDAKAISRYAITNSQESPSSDSDQWRTPEQTADERVTEINVSKVIEAKGTYHAHVEDDGGNVTTSSPVYVYELSFRKGPEPAQGEMSSILKVGNVSVRLPSVSYTYTGYNFQNWSAVIDESSVTFSNGAQYTENADAVLTANWSNVVYTYMVKYWFMNTAGEYEGADAEEVSYTCASGTTVSANAMPDLMISRKGFTLDTSKSESKVIDQEGLTVNLYYARNQYTLTYTLTGTDQVTTTTSSVDCYYEEDIQNKNVQQAVAGYTFIGWKYSNIGSDPNHMPAHDVSASGYYKPDDARYTINYYIQSLKDDTNTEETKYTLYSSEVVQSAHGTVINAKTAEAEAIEGFTAFGITAIYAQAEASSEAEAVSPETEITMTQQLKETLATEVSPAASSLGNQNLVINYYYTRNTYKLWLKIWTNDSRSEVAYEYGWDKKYGETITFADYENYDSGNWAASAAEAGVNTDNYIVSDYSDWSTGLIGDGVTSMTMPAGEVTVSRQYIPSIQDRYDVQVFLDSDTQADGNGIYSETPNYTLTYYGALGSEVSVTDYTDLEHYIDYFDECYEIDESTTGNSYKGVITDTKQGGDPLTLKLYFKKKKITAKIRYYFDNGSGEYTQFAELTQEGKWNTEYSFYPLKYYYKDSSDSSSEGLIEGVTIQGSTPDQYDFNENLYSVSTLISYDQSSSSHTYNTACPPSSVSAQYGHAYWYNINTPRPRVDVYYTKVDTARTYVYDYVLDLSTVKDHLGDAELAEAINTEKKLLPITYTDDSGKKYKLRAANLSYLTDSVRGTGTDNDDYKVLSALNGTSTAATTVKDGFTQITINDHTYYTSEETGGPYIYIPMADNPYFVGNYGSASYSGEVAADFPFVADWIQTYITNHSVKDSTEYEYDESASALYIYHRGTSVLKLSDSQGNVSNATVAVTLRYHDTYRLQFSLENQIMSDSMVYPEGTTLPNTEAGIQSVYAIAAEKANAYTQKEGYDIVWYKDASYETPLTSEDTYTMNATHTVFGRYELSHVVNHLYVNYQLSDPYTDPQTSNVYYYVTDAILAQICDPYKTAVETADVTYEDEFNRVHTVAAKKTTYYDSANNPIRIDLEMPGNTHQELKVENAKIGNYGLAGFYYDDTNTGNKLYGYCETKTSPVSLCLNYARNKHSLEIDNQLEKDNVVAAYTKRYGETVTVPVPTKEGYTFSKWKVYVRTENNAGYTYTENTELEASLSLTAANAVNNNFVFRMPDDDIKLEADWAAAEFPNQVRYYFQDVEGHYQSGLLNTVGSAETQSITAILDGREYSATAYVSGNSVLAVSVIHTGSNEEKYTAYYVPEDTEISDSTCTINAWELAVAVRDITVTSDTEYSAGVYSYNAGLLPAVFTFKNAHYEYEGQVASLAENGTFTAMVGMQLDYFYSRDNGYVIRTAGYATDAGETGLTLSGSGTYYYGKRISLKAVVADGYEFVGWYKAEDVRKTESDQGGGADSSSGYVLDTEKLESSEKLSANEILVLDVTQAGDYVAVTRPILAQIESVTISGRNEYEYGYAASITNQLSAAAAYNTDSGSDDYYVSGYQWYQVTADDNGEKTYSAISNAKSGTYDFETGKAAGEYVYACDATVVSKRNGRSVTQRSGDYTVTVKPKALSAEPGSYTGYYDGQPHNISLKVTGAIRGDSPVIYYSTEELTAENYLLKGQTEFGMSDVKTDSDHKAVAYTVYYYVSGLSEGVNNYIDCSGSSTVLIKSKTITLQATGNVFTRYYDASTRIAGDVTDVNTDKGKIAGGNYFTLSGLAGADSSSTSNNFKVDFTGTYNYKDAGKATSITLTDIHLVYAQGDHRGETNYNYAIPKSLVIGGNITKMPVAIEWDDTRAFTYDGQEHMPEASWVIADTSYYLESAVSSGDSDPAVSLRSDLSELKTELAALSVTRSGAKIEVGSYNANATIAVTGDYLLSNYQQVATATGDETAWTDETTSVCAYSINKKSITVRPVSDLNIIYDGAGHDLTGFVIIDGDSTDGSGYTLPTVTVNGDEVTYTADRFTTDATASPKIDVNITGSETGYGAYTVTATNLDIFAGAEEVTKNYEITYDSAELMISPRRVTVSGILAADKSYDTTTGAVILLTDPKDPNKQNPSIKIATLVDGESLQISGVKGSFSDADAGQNKTVTLNYDEATLLTVTPSSTKASNYVLDVESADCQKTATASITGYVVATRPKDVSGIYGQDVSGLFGYEFYNYDQAIFNPTMGNPGFSVEEGKPSYKVKKTGSEELQDYSATLDAGEYEIVLVTENDSEGSETNIIDGIAGDNYTFVRGDNATLTITPRPVQVIEKKGYENAADTKITKIYNAAKDTQTLSTGTTGTSGYCLNSAYYSFRAVKGDKNSGILTGDAGKVKVNGFTSEYDDIHVSDQRKVYVKEMTLNSSNYVLANTEYSEDGITLTNAFVLNTAEITVRSLIIKADKQSITYGDNAPEYTVTYEGLAGGDTGESLTTQPTCSCRYDTEDREKRNAGTYAITAGGAADIDYAITYEEGSLVVHPSVLAVVATDQAITYADVLPAASGEVQYSGYGNGSLEYNNQKVQYKGLLYDDQVNDVIEGEPVFTHAESVRKNVSETDRKCFAVAGSYTITAAKGTLEAVNYTFEPVNGTLTISKKDYITVSGITIADKVYDGTTAVSSADNLSLSATADHYSDIEERDLGSAGIVIDLNGTKYDTADAGVDKKVTLSYTLNEYLSARYKLSPESQKEITGAVITKAPLTIQANDVSVDYGTSTSDVISEFGFTYGDQAADGQKTNYFVTGEVEEENITGSVWYSCGYQGEADSGSFTAAGIYADSNPCAITPCGYSQDHTEGIQSSNYDITFKPGTLTVRSVNFEAPVVSWNEEAPGVLTWTKPAAVGDTYVTGYTLQLYRDEKADGTKAAVGGQISISNADTKTYDFLQTIRTAGEGRYYVKVTALSSNTNNVADTASDTNAPDYTYAAKVRVVFAEDAASTAGGVGTALNGKSVTPEGTGVSVGTDIIVAGESLPYSVTLTKNGFANADGNKATGYYIDDVAVTNAATGGSVLPTTAKVPDSRDEKLDYSGTISAGYDMDVTQAEVTVTLKPEKAQVKAALSLVGETEGMTTEAYDALRTLTYGYTTQPVIQCNPSVVEGDTITDTANYTYTYQWEIKWRSYLRTEDSINTETDSQLKFPLGKRTNYGSNGGYYISCTVTAQRKDNEETASATVIKDKYIIVNKATAVSRILRKDTQESYTGWTFGEPRHTPVLNWKPEDSKDAVYAYSTQKDGQYTNDIPNSAAAGTYWVRAYVSGSENYEDYYTYQEFTIAQAKLAKPEASMRAVKGVAPYGDITWSAVEGLKENGDSDTSVITPSYYVVLYHRKSVDGHEEKVQVWEMTYTDSSTVSTGDISQYMSNEGIYSFTVQAVSNHPGNCDHSDIYTSDDIDISHEIVSYRTGTTDYQTRKIYDGKTITLSLKNSPTGTHQWYKNNEIIEGATGATYEVRDVSETGKYTCKVGTGTGTGTISYSTIGEITINPRPIIVSTESSEKIYDGNPLTNGNNTAVLDTSAIESAQLALQDKTGDTYNTAGSGDVITVTNTGSLTYVAENKENNNTCNVVIKQGETDVSGNYDISYNIGTLTIKPRSITVTTGSASKIYDATALTKTYDGEPLTYDTLSQANGAFSISEYNAEASAGLAEGDAIALDLDKSITYAAEGLEVTEDQNRHYRILNSPESTVITRAAGSNTTVDVTSSYNINLIYGMLRLYPRTLTITASDWSKTYDGTPLISTAFSSRGIESEAGEGINNGLVTGDVIDAEKLTFTGERTVAGTTVNGNSVSGEETGLITRTSEGSAADVTKCYAITYEAGDLTVEQRPITITAGSAEKVYDATALTKDSYTCTSMNPTAENLGNTGLAYQDKVDSVTVTGSQTVAGSSDNMPSGARIMNASNKDVTGSYDITYTKGTLTVTKKALTIMAESASQTYDGTPLTKDSYTHTDLAEGDAIATETDADGKSRSTVTVTGSQTVAGSSDNMPSGAKIMNADGEDVTESYEITYTKGTLTVTRKALTITADSAEKVYDATVLTRDSYTYTALAEGDAIATETDADGKSRSTVTVTGSQTTAGSSANVPSGAQIVNSSGEDVTGSYEITYKNGTLKVTKKAVTITANSSEKVYDGTTLTNDAYSNTTLAQGDSIQSVTVTGGRTIVGSDVNRPSKAKIVNTAGEDVTASYEISYVYGDLKVTARPITIKADSEEKVYDGTALTKHTFTNTTMSQNAQNPGGEGLVTGDTITSVSFSGSQTVAGTADNVPSHAKIRDSYGVDVTASYDITYVKGTLEVTARPITIKADSEEKVYDGTALTKNTYSNTTMNPTAENLGEKGLALGDLIESVTVTGSRTMAGTSANSPSEAKIVNGQKEDVTSSYQITYADGSLKITERPITITADDARKVYDGTALTKNTFTNTTMGQNAQNPGGEGLVTGDKITSVSFSGSQTVAGKADNVPSDAKIRDSYGVDVTASYDITYVKGSLEVTARPITITAADAQKVYDGTALTKNTFTNTTMNPTAENLGEKGLALGDLIESVTVTGSQTMAGTSANTPSEAKIVNGQKEDVTSSYQITYANGSLKITARPITITAEDAQKVYDGTALTKNTFTNTTMNPTAENLGEKGLALGDLIESVTVTGSQTVAGTSANTPSKAKIVNGQKEDVTSSYQITYTSGTLRVTKKSITITAGSATRAYNAQALSQNSYTDSGLGSGDECGSVQVSGSQLDVGSSPNVASKAVILHKEGGKTEDVTSSYDIHYAQGTLTVTKSKLTITASSDSWEYDGHKHHNSGYSVTSDPGLWGNDRITDVTVTGEVRYIHDTKEGNNIASNAVIRNGERNVTDNYEITYLPGTLTVSESDHTLIITSHNGQWTYDGQPHTSQYYEVIFGSGEDAEHTDIYYLPERPKDAEENGFYLSAQNGVSGGKLFSAQGDDQEKASSQEDNSGSSSRASSGAGTVKTLKDEQGMTCYSVELPTHDILTIYPKNLGANGITNVKQTSDQNNLFTYKLDNSEHYTAITKNQISLNYGKLTVNKAKPVLTVTKKAGTGNTDDSAASDSGKTAYGRLVELEVRTTNTDPDVKLTTESFNKLIAKSAAETMAGTTTDISGALGTDAKVTITPTGLGEVKLTITSPATDNFEEISASYTLQVSIGSLEAVASDTGLEYTGSKQSAGPGALSLSDDQVTKVEYSTDGKTWSSDMPHYTDAGSYITYYKITSKYYDEVTQSWLSYYEPVVGSWTTTIAPKSILDSTITIDAIPVQRWTGSAITPVPVIRDQASGKVLQEGVDYTVSYSSNVNEGTASITLSGMGNYQFTRTAQYNIEKETFVLTFNPGGGNWDGSTESVRITCKVGDTIQIYKAPQKSGYRFIEWQGSSYQPGDNYVVTGDHTFTAVWEKQSAGTTDTEQSTESERETGNDDDPGRSGKNKNSDKSGRTGSTETELQTAAPAALAVLTGDDTDLRLYWFMLLLSASAFASLAYVSIRRKRGDR